jgi:hypothetical protein
MNTAWRAVSDAVGRMEEAFRTGRGGFFNSKHRLRAGHLPVFGAHSVPPPRRREHATPFPLPLPVLLAR